MISAPDRRATLALIDAARTDGARPSAACAELGLAARTVQRWRGPDGSVPDCKGRSECPQNCGLRPYSRTRSGGMVIGAPVLGRPAAPLGRWWWGDGGVGAGVFGDEVGVLAQAVAGALDLDDDGVVQEAVEHRRGDDGIAEHFTPLCEAAVGGEDHRALLVSYALTSWKNRLAPPEVIGR